MIYVGAKTGRDGIHGASLLASAEFSEESQQKRPNVQVGDPFLEKLLLEACLEAMRTGAIVGIQDMGAAGLTSTSSEMASRGGAGIEIDLARVPQRETGMTPYEMMLSESQERMLLVAERGREHEVFDVFRKWGLDAVEIGRVTDDGKLRVLNHGRVAAEIPAHALAEEGPRYERPIAAPKAPRQRARRIVEFAPRRQRISPRISAGCSLARRSRRNTGSPSNTIHMVRTNTRVGPGAGDAAVRSAEGNASARLRFQPTATAAGAILVPAPGRHARRRRSRAQRGLHRRAPLRRDQLPEFRQSRKARGDVAVQRSDRRNRRSLPRCSTFPSPAATSASTTKRWASRSIPRRFWACWACWRTPDCALGSGFRTEGDCDFACSTARSSDAAVSQRRPSESASFSSSEYAKTIHGIVGGRASDDRSGRGKAPDRCLVVSGGRARDFVGARCQRRRRGRHPGRIRLRTATDFRRRLIWAISDEPAEFALFGERGARAVVSVAPASLARVAGHCGTIQC